jgi:hypothetical protein
MNLQPQQTVPVFCQGVLKSRKEGRAVVEWLERSESQVAAEFVHQLGLVDVGQSFTCRAKFVDHKLVELRQVEPLFLPEAVDISWIKAFQPAV